MRYPPGDQFRTGTFNPTKTLILDVDITTKAISPDHMLCSLGNRHSPTHFQTIRARRSQCWLRARADQDALGYAAAAEQRRSSGDQHPEYLVTALARLAEAREPVPRPVQQLCRICTRAQSGDQKERYSLVRPER
jgi:hypothetical protein